MSTKEANISSVFDKGLITFSDIDKGNQVFNPSTNTTTFTFFKEGTENSSSLLSLNLETPTEKPKELIIPQTTQQFFTLVLFDYPDQYLLSSDPSKTTISSIVPDIDSNTPAFNELASDSNFIVNKDDLVVLKKDEEKITVVNVNTDVSLIIAVASLTPDPTVFDQSTQVTKFQPIAYVNSDKSEATALGISKIYPIHVPITGSVPLYLEGNLYLPGTRPYMIIKYDPLDMVLARLPIQTKANGMSSAFKPYVTSKDLTGRLPPQLLDLDTFLVSVQIQLISDVADPISISTNTQLTLFNFDIVKISPKQAYFGDKIFVMSTFFPPNNDITLSIRQQFSNEETRVECRLLNSTFCSARLPLLDSSDTLINIKASLSGSSVSSNYNNKIFIRYLNPEVVKVTSLDSFDTNITPPESIPDQDVTPPVIQRIESTDSVQAPLIMKMNIAKLNKSKCTDKPIRQVVASSDLHDISNSISLDFKLSPFSNIENGNLIEFWITKKNNGTFFGSLAFERGKQVLSAGELSSGLKSSSSCSFSSGTLYRISLKLSKTGTRWEIRNVNFDVVDCSLTYVSDNTPILENSKGYQFGIGQCFSCAQLMSNISQIPDLIVNSMMEVCVTCSKPSLLVDQLDYLPYILGGAIGLVVLLALVAFGISVIIWRVVKKKKVVGQYVYYDNNTSRQDTLQDLFEKINTNTSVDSVMSTTEEFFEHEQDEDDLIRTGATYNTWV